jgi:hypothetical protein
MQSELSCRLEVQMIGSLNNPEQGQDTGSGRIDLLVQTDSDLNGWHDRTLAQCFWSCRYDEVGIRWNG